MKHLILRTCNQDLISANNFQWKMGKNIAPDWDPQPYCGYGLHGLLWGEGHGSLLNYHKTSKWLVGEIEEYVDLGGKVKFPECNIIFIGNQEQATQFLYENSNNKAISGLIMKGNNIKSGDGSELTGEDGANIVTGRSSTVIAGNNCSIKTGYNAHITAGNNCSISVTQFCTVTAGDNSNIITGNNCSISVSDNSTVRTGYDCQITYCDKTANFHNGLYKTDKGEIVYIA